MTERQIEGITLVTVAAFMVLLYVFMTPYNRVAGIRIGGFDTPPPDDWRAVDDQRIIQLKTGGFPPFVVNVVYAGAEDGVITATRPDGGYWARRARENPDGWLRIGNATYAMRATEILGDDRLPLLEAYGEKNGMRMDAGPSGGMIQGQAEPLSTWEVFFWTPR